MNGGADPRGEPEIGARLGLQTVAGTRATRVRLAFAMADKTCIALFDYQGDGEPPTGGVLFGQTVERGGGVIVSLVLRRLLFRTVLSLSSSTIALRLLGIQLIQECRSTAGSPCARTHWLRAASCDIRVLSNKLQHVCVCVDCNSLTGSGNGRTPDGMDGSMSLPSPPCPPRSCV